MRKPFDYNHFRVCTRVQNVGERSPSRLGLLLLALTAACLTGAAAPARAATIVWTAAESPVVLTSDFVVEGGDVLRIEPGVEVRLDPGVSLRILGGRLDAVGSETDSIRFVPNQSDTHWGALRFEQSADNVLSYARLCAGDHFDTTRAAPGGMVELITESALDMSRCVLESCLRNGLWCRYGSRFIVSDCLIRNTGGEGINAEHRSTGSVYRCEIYSTDGDAMEIHGDPNDPVHVIIAENVLHDTTDDAIDTDSWFLGTVTGNLIYACEDNGLSLATESTVEVTNNIITDCGGGMSIYAGAHADIANCTINECASGLRVWRREDGWPSATATAVNTIVWDCDESIFVEAGSSLEITYSDIGELHPGAGNISENPKFRHAAARDFRLSPRSPCIDAGSGEWPAPTKDIEGRPRFDDLQTDDTGIGPVSYIDIGAHEYTASGPVTGAIAALQVRPNPADEEFGVMLSLTVPSTVRVRLYDVAGQLVHELRTGELGVGDQLVPFLSRGRSRIPRAGVYFIEAETAHTRARGTVVLR